MVRAEDRALADVAATVADGGAVDWMAAGGRVPDRQRRLIRHLQLVESISRLHRTLAADADADAAADDAALAAGLEPLRWGPFVLLERIGEGVSGEVYRAWDSRLHRDVALKLLRHGGSRRDTAHQRVLDEARRLARIRHPHVVQIYGAESHDGRVGLWMELLKGQSLDRLARTRVPLAGAEVAHYGRHLCAALSAVHAAGLLHRDVKAQNVIVEESGRTVLMDLGTGEELRRSVGTNRLVGTPLYLAPEIFRGEPATVQSDVYSLGVLLFHLATGQFPVSATTLQELAQAHKQGRRLHLSEVRSDLSPALVRAIEAALEPRPSMRVRTTTELDVALAAASAAPSAARRPWRFVGVASALAAAVLALIVWSGGLPGLVSRRVRTVAVAPMATIDPAATPAYLALGLTDQLISTLGRIESLRVRSALPRVESAAVLDARAGDAVLETSVQLAPSRAGASPRIRVTARLLEVGSGRLIWADSFVEAAGDTFALQATMARRIATALNAAVTRDERAQLSAVRQTSPEAEAAYLEGRAYIGRYGVEDWQQALQSFKRAVDLDPSFAPAHAALARAQVTLGFADAISHPVARTLALPAAQRAAELDPSLAEAHATLADIAFYYDWNWEAAEAGYGRSLDLNPSSVYTRTQYAHFLAAARRTADAVSQADLVVDLQASSPPSLRLRALMLYYHREFEAARQAIDQALSVDGQAAGGWAILGRIAEAQGDTAAALQHTERSLRLAGTGPSLLRVQQMRMQALAGDAAGARSALRGLRADSERRGRLWNPLFDAHVHLAVGQVDQALAALEEAVQERQPSLLWMAVDPRFDSLRSHPRFQALVRELGLE